MFEGNTAPPPPHPTCLLTVPSRPWVGRGASFWLPRGRSWNQEVSTALAVSPPSAWSCQGQHFPSPHLQQGARLILKRIHSPKSPVHTGFPERVFMGPAIFPGVDPRAPATSCQSPMCRVSPSHLQLLLSRLEYEQVSEQMPMDPLTPSEPHGLEVYPNTGIALYPSGRGENNDCTS